MCEKKPFPEESGKEKGEQKKRRKRKKCKEKRWATKLRGLASCPSRGKADLWAGCSLQRKVTPPGLALPARCRRGISKGSGVHPFLYQRNNFSITHPAHTHILYIHSRFARVIEDVARTDRESIYIIWWFRLRNSGTKGKWINDYCKTWRRNKVFLGSSTGSEILKNSHPRAGNAVCEWTLILPAEQQRTSITTQLIWKDKCPRTHHHLVILKVYFCGKISHSRHYPQTSKKTS